MSENTSIVTDEMAWQIEFMRERLEWLTHLARYGEVVKDERGIARVHRDLLSTIVQIRDDSDAAVKHLLGSTTQDDVTEEK